MDGIKKGVDSHKCKSVIREGKKKRNWWSVLNHNNHKHPKIVSCGSKNGSQGRIKPNPLAPNAKQHH